MLSIGPYRNIKYLVNMCNARVNPQVLWGALEALDVYWVMSEAQLASLDALYMEVTEFIPREDTREIAPRERKLTLLGFPVHIKEGFPNSWIRLYQSDKIIGQIELLAIPVLYNDGENWMTAEPERCKKQWEEDERGKDSPSHH